METPMKEESHEALPDTSAGNTRNNSHRVIIALGSCCRPVVHIQWATQHLQQQLVDMRQSRLLWTADIKGSGRMYMNRLVAGYTPLSLSELEQQLKAIEQRCGRHGTTVTIDLDVMLYDDLRCHLRDWPRPYIQKLINEI